MEITVSTYEDNKDTGAKRNADASVFFAKNHPNPKEDVFLYTDLLDTFIFSEKNEKGYA